MTRDLLQHIKDHFQPGVRIRLISMVREPQMPEGLKGIVSSVDDVGQIHTNWENGSSLALVPDIDKFIAYNGPTAEEYLREKYPANANIWFREDIPGGTRAVSVGMVRLTEEVELYLDKITSITGSLAQAMGFPCDTVTVYDAFLSNRVLTDESAMELMGKTEYSKEESEQERCPKCGSDKLEYGTAEFDDGPSVSYPWDCNDCGAKGVENGAITFDGHRVTRFLDYI
jgi:predicted nucleic-acid-binding Zn-ribbon protein